jgi:hypothetical protein
LLEPKKAQPANSTAKRAVFDGTASCRNSFEYITEMVLQRGSWGADSVQAWAGFWRLGRLFPNTRWQPHFRFEAMLTCGL